MRGGQRVATHVLGYPIERQEHYTDDGSSRTTRYQVRCPETGAVLGQLPSLRMAKRFVVSHELRDFSARSKRDRSMRDRSVA